MNSRRAARMIVLQTLYEVDMTQHAPGVVLSRHFNDTPDLPEETRTLASELVSGVMREYPILDNRIAECATAFPVNELATIDRNLLRMALFELSRNDVPYKVVINEAVEIAREFGSENAHKFINGALASAMMRYHPERLKADASVDAPLNANASEEISSDRD